MEQGDEFGWGHVVLQTLHIPWSTFANMSKQEKLLTMASCAVQMEMEKRACDRLPK